jgi:hypothetical protein
MRGSYAVKDFIEILLQFQLYKSSQFYSEWRAIFTPFRINLRTPSSISAGFCNQMRSGHCVQSAAISHFDRVRVCQTGLCKPFDPLHCEEKHAELAWLLPEGRRSP